jgi:hypothetical protein
MAQFSVVVQVFIAQGQGIDSLFQEFLRRVFATG